MFIKQTKNVFEAIECLQYEKTMFVKRFYIKYCYNFTKKSYISMHHSEKQPPVLKTRKLVAIAQNCHSYVVLSIAAQKVTFPSFVTF